MGAVAPDVSVLSEYDNPTTGGPYARGRLTKVTDGSRTITNATLGPDTVTNADLSQVLRDL